MRKLMWFTMGFGAACALGSYFWLGDRAIGLAMLGLIAAIGCWFGRDYRAAKRAGAVFLGFGIGMAWFFAYDAVYTQPIRELDGQTVNLELTTCTYSWETDYGSAVDCYLDLEGKRYKVRLYLNEAQDIEPWTTIETPVKVRLTTDGGQNEPTFHRSNGILALCYQRDEAAFSVRDESTTGCLVMTQQAVRKRLTGIIDECFPGETAAFAKALLLGDRTDIGYEMSSDFSVTGISHIVAVSGLHVSILFALFYALSGKRRFWLAVMGIPAVLVFMAITGFTPSVTRAGIMQILMILALCVNREYDPPTALSFAALVMLIVNPLVASSAGFQMSVGSVAGIFLFSAPIRGWLADRIPDKKNKLWSKLKNWLISGVSVTLAAQFFTTPLVAAYYGTVSLVGIVTNLAVLWVVSFIFYGVMLVCLLGLLSLGAAKVVAWVIAWPVRYVIGTAGLLAKVPLAAVYTKSPYILFWLALCYAMIFVLIFSRGKRPLVSACVACLGLVTALTLSWVEPMLNDHRVTAVDVGQGQCVILQHRGKTFVVDCGGDYADSAADACAQTLLSMGVQRIDGLILTHYDADHAGGAAYLLHRIRASALYLPYVPDEMSAVPKIQDAAGEAQIFWVNRDLILESDGMKLTLFAPETGTSGNESSIAVLFQTEKCDTLITGDMSELGERILLKRAQIPELELLIVGHHGSKSSTSEELLAATSPEIAIISVGENNRYNHPNQEVLERLTAAGCAVYRTDQMGDITFRR